MDGPHGPTSTATRYVQKQEMQAGFLHPKIWGTMGASWAQHPSAHRRDGVGGKLLRTLLEQSKGFPPTVEKVLAV